MFALRSGIFTFLRFHVLFDLFVVCFAFFSHRCFNVPFPPNLTLSLKNLQIPQSCEAIVEEISFVDAFVVVVFPDVSFDLLMTILKLCHAFSQRGFSNYIPSLGYGLP